MTTPSTTESATNRIDLDRLSAALEAAGWTEDHDHYWDGEHRYVLGNRYVQLDAKRLRIWQRGQYPRDLYGVIDPLDPHWQHALDIIRAHTAPTPARSHAAGTPGEENGDPDPNTPEGGNEKFDPREWIDEETGVRFMDGEEDEDDDD